MNTKKSTPKEKKIYLYNFIFKPRQTSKIKYPSMWHSIDHTTVYGDNNQLVTPPRCTTNKPNQTKQAKQVAGKNASKYLLAYFFTLHKAPAIALLMMMAVGASVWGQSQNNITWNGTSVGGYYSMCSNTRYTNQNVGTCTSCTYWHRVTMAANRDQSGRMYFKAPSGCTLTITLVAGSTNLNGTGNNNRDRIRIYDENNPRTGNGGTAVRDWYSGHMSGTGNSSDNPTFTSTIAGGWVTLRYDNGNNTNSNFRITIYCNCCTQPDWVSGYGCPNDDLTVGGTANLRVTGGNVTWSATPAGIVNFSTTTGTNTTITGASAGTATITATITAANGYCAGTLTCNVTVAASGSSNCTQVGTDNSTTQYVPSYQSQTQCYSYTQQLYRANEITTAGGCKGAITDIQFNATSAFTPSMDIYIGSTSQTTIPDDAWVTDANLTPVFSGSISFVNGWANIHLDTPYDWDGTSNIVVAVNTTTKSSVASFRASYIENCAAYYYDFDAVTLNSIYTYNYQDARVSYRPNIKFCMDCCTPREGSAQITNTCPINLTYGNTVQLNGTVETGEGTASWTSSNTGVATVDGGLVSPRGIGSTTITYTRANDGNYCETSATCTINVTVPTPTVTQTDDPLPQCNDGDATLVATVTSIPPGYTFHWYRNSDCTDEITSDVSGTNHENLSYAATNGGQVWCRLEKPGYEDEQTFTYNGTNGSDGSIQTYTIPEDATSLTLEVWGAQGGSYNDTYVGGRGGYSKGTLTSPSGGSTLYVVVGGQPGSVISTSGGTAVNGGYNGGGAAVVHNYSGGYSVPQGGGGATHIATVSGVLRDLSTQQDNVLIVAGGGSGGVYYYNHGTSTNGGGTGYAGGGATSNAYPGTNGRNYDATQDRAGNGGGFGRGASYTGNTDYRYGPAGGGGGWYGGGNRQNANDTYNAELVLGHGGGSGYVKGTLSDPVNNTGGRDGNGQAKITAYSPKITGPAGTVTIQCCGLNATIEFGD